MSLYGIVKGTTGVSTPVWPPQYFFHSYSTAAEITYLLNHLIAYTVYAPVVPVQLET